MAYVIGSQKGKDIAKNMTVGSTYKASDGSTWTKKSDGSVSVTTSGGQTYNNAYSPTSSGGSSNKNSQYTGSSNSIVATNGTQQSIKDKMNSNSIAWWSADEAGKKQLEAENKTLAAILGGTVSYNAGTGTWSGTAAGNTGTSKEDILGWENEYEQNNPKEEYESKYDPQINALLNKILNRDDFSYDVMNDPLYQQYAAMYQREGERAMKNTMAEAAAGAGGMNTYAVTAAQQANSYYNSQLNDMIPQLYQLAYEMYLNDKESKVQDLGILQNMDATQYGRYRDTINDYYTDKNFAFNAYQKAVEQGNWQANFDYNAMWDNTLYNNDNYWKNKEFDFKDYWANKDYETSQSDKEYERNQYDEERAYDLIVDQIGRGVTSIDPTLIEQAGITQAVVNQMIADHQLKNKKTGGSGGGGDGGGNPKKKITEDDNGNPKDEGGNPTGDGSGNYAAVAKACDELAANGDEWSAAAYANEAKEAGLITQKEYNSLIAEYNPALDAILRPSLLKDYSFGWGKN